MRAVSSAQDHTRPRGAEPAGAAPTGTGANDDAAAAAAPSPRLERLDAELKARPADEVRLMLRRDALSGRVTGETSERPSPALDNSANFDGRTPTLRAEPFALRSPSLGDIATADTL